VSSLLAPRFLPRDRPLPPIAVAIPRSLVRPLAERAGRDPAEFSSLRALGSPSCLLLFGEAEALPWVDGAVFLGRDEAAPRLLVPTAVAPDLPYDLLERALFAAAPSAHAPCALLLDPLRLVDAAYPAPFDAPSLARWVASRAGPERFP
jgi:hypothetical protein